VGSVGAPELIVIFLVALIVLGPDRLPKAARQVGRAIAEFKRVTGGFQDEVRRAFDGDEPGSPAAPSSTTSSAPRDDSGEHMVGRPAAASPTPDVDLPPPPDDPSFN